MRIRAWHVILGVALAILLWVVGGYNGLITGKESVTAAWAQVETQYQRRVDLIPNLVETVKGAARFERETFDEITSARTRWMNAGSRGEKIESALGVESALARLIVTFENYPQLQATQAYRDLMAQLEGTENRIGVARRDFNLAVRSFNLKVKRFPGNLLARWFGFEQESFFEAVEGSATVPKVSF